jgi:NADH-quinone oxidoreductase subunit C
MSTQLPTRAQALAARMDERFRVLGARTIVASGEVTLEVPAEHLAAVCRALREDGELAFEQLMDLCGVDYLSYGLAEWTTSEQATRSGFSRGVDRGVALTEGSERPERFAVVYHLLSQRHNRRLRLRVFAPGDPPRVASVAEVWSSANWFEREAFDLYGILFDGHPDLRRILTDYGFIGHPFRKDFPLIGQVEMRYDPERGRVVYQPVTIQPRVLVPKVIRHDGFPGGEREGEPAGHG